MAPFGFGKKGGDKREKRQDVEQNPTPEPPKFITISEAQALVREIESRRLSELNQQLGPIRDETLESLSALAALADSMEKEQIKFEEGEARHKSVVENSKRAVISTLKRETSSELLLPASVNDVKKFKDRLESMMSRFGEVSGSHSRVLNYFLKKQSAKIKSEFEELDGLLKQTRTIVADFESRRTPIVKCNNLLNTAAQMLTSSKSAENAVRSVEEDVKVLESQILQTQQELFNIRQSKEYPQAVEALENVSRIEMKLQANRDRCSELFSHVSRGLTKYSYGLGKESTSKIQTMAEEPWRILDGDIEPYSQLLTELRKSVAEGSMQLKDSDKITQYIDSVISSLPELKQTHESIRQESMAATGNQTKGLAIRAKDLEATLSHEDEKLASSKLLLEQQKKQLAQKEDEIRRVLSEAQDLLGTLSGSRYTLQSAAVAPS